MKNLKYIIIKIRTFLTLLLHIYEKQITYQYTVDTLHMHFNYFYGFSVNLFI